MSQTQPSIRFFRGPTGHRVAYATHGAGPPLLCSAWWVSHVEEDWTQPGFRRFFGGLAEHFTVIRYDRPGSGLSDRERSRVSVDEELDTLRALRDHLELERTSLFGLTCAAPPALMLAAEAPERVDRIVLFGAYVKGHDLAPRDVQLAARELVRTHWGMGSQMLTDLFAPDLDAEGRKTLARLQRIAASQEMAAALMNLTFEGDVTETAARVEAAALVMHRKGDRAIPFRAGRELAATLPNATFCPLAGDAHVPWHGDVDAARDALLEFFGVGEPEAPPAPGPSYALIRDGDVWTLTYRGERALLKDARGLADLAILLSNPDEDIHVGRLWSGAETQAELGQVDDPVLDEEALAAYRKRLEEIDASLADASGPKEKRLRAERDALARELRAAVGLGGRSRALDKTSERARKAVTARIRASIKKITEALPRAGLHLSQRVSTGAHCAYRGSDEVRWEVR